jgi:hypothetical protein
MGNGESVDFETGISARKETIAERMKRGIEERRRGPPPRVVPPPWLGGGATTASPS